MTYNPELWRTEELHKFRSRGDLKDHGQVVVGNAGLAAKYNPIPSILEWMIERPCSENRFLAMNAIQKHLIEQAFCKARDAAGVATDVINWFISPHCPACHGTGVKNIEQETCPTCGGAAKHYPESELSRKGCVEIESLFAWREIQLRKRNKS